jgi:hypothetical protein
MANPNRISNGEAIAGKFITRTTYKFQDETEYSTALVHYISCFDDSTQTSSTTTPTPFHYSTTDVSKGISIVSDGVDLRKIVFDHAGVYNFIWSGQFENSSSSAQDVFVWFRKNGVDIAGSTGLAAVPGSHAGTNGHAIIGWNFFISVNAGDYVQIMWMKSSASITLPFYAATADYPSTASVVLTINQIA